MKRGAKQGLLGLTSVFKAAGRSIRAIMPSRKPFNARSTDFDKRLVYSFSKTRIPRFEQLKHVGLFLSKKEIWAIRASIAVILISTSYLSVRYAAAHLTTIPASGGTYKEGLVGSPKFINPLYSGANDVDNDLVKLMFSSLYSRGSGGELAPDLATGEAISADGITYTYSIREDAKWSNGDPLTADDIVFTFNAIKDPSYHAHTAKRFAGVTIEKADDRTVKFLLSEPYAGFRELLTFGILPQALWQPIDPANAMLSDLNRTPVGSGQFVFESMVRDKKSGGIRSYSLKRNESYYGRLPYLEKITFIFYPSYEEALSDLNQNNVDGISYLPPELAGTIMAPIAYNFHRLELPLVSALFFNKDKDSNLSDKQIRQALAFATPRDKLVKETLGESYYLADGPIMKSSFAYSGDQKRYEYDKAKALELFKKSGWEPTVVTDEMIKKAEQDAASNDEKAKAGAQEVLSAGAGSWLAKNGKYFKLVLSTIDRPENTTVADFLKASWKDVGVGTEIALIPVAEVQSEVIDKRNFSVLLYGMTLGMDPDPYVFWHSSQKADGLNVAGFSSLEADKLLEAARATTSVPVRQEKYRAFQAIISEEEPAVFLYSRYYTYVQDSRVKGFDTRVIAGPQDRFSNIGDWFMKTSRKLEF